ncbi:MAG: Hsp20/alpha crystallin family protein [Candidatus Hadarchaeum sp.]|uniref:Hsp20/alpha crystallin family protein n=1 Tax=Candidatus Hadarchaeum sp. TaxID=2883567 RepID=UPI003D0984E9
MFWMDVFDEMRRMQREINRMFGDFFARPMFVTPRTPTWMGWREPLIDLWEDEENVTLRAELPGVDKEDIKLNVTEDSLEIKVLRKKESKAETAGVQQMERSYGGFYRYLQLPCRVIPEKATATYNNGILEIKIPKAEKTKRGFEVKVQ